MEPWPAAGSSSDSGSLAIPMTGGSVRVRLPPTIEAPRLARRAVAERLGQALTPSVLNDAKLIVSEIVTNSVQHAKLQASDWIGLAMSLEAASRVARVEVFDPGDGFDAPTTKPELLAKGGRGLHLVEQLALRWGVIRDAMTMVWFEVQIDAR